MSTPHPTARPLLLSRPQQLCVVCGGSLQRRAGLVCQACFNMREENNRPKLVEKVK